MLGRPMDRTVVRRFSAAIAVACLSGAAVSLAAGEGVRTFGGGGKRGSSTSGASASTSKPASLGGSKGVISFGKDPMPVIQGVQKAEIAPPPSPTVEDIFAKLLAAMGAEPGDEKWNPAYDLNKNGLIDADDLNFFLSELSKIKAGQATPQDAQLAKLQEALGSKVGDALYDPVLDMNSDGVINTIDLNLFMAQAGGSGVVVDQNGLAIVGPAPTPEAPFITGLDANGQLVVIDADTDKGIIVPNGNSLWLGSNQNASDYLEPDVQVSLAAGGADVVYTYTNSTSSPKKLGALRLGGIRFGKEIGTRRIRLDGAPSEKSHNGQPKWLGGHIYPNDLYSPVAILQEGDYTVGISFAYPVLDYKHHCFVQWEAAKDTNGYGTNWQISGVLNGTGSYHPEADIQPGESRVYVMSVRVHKGDPEDWVTTLTPYRSFFQATYGGVKYPRNPEPILGVTPASSLNLSPENPFGFGYGDCRPDLYGWGGWVAKLTDEVNGSGWTRITMKSPSGLFLNNQDANFPTQILTQMSNVPAMNNSVGLLKDFAQSYDGFGMWWGRSSTVMHNWDPTPDQTELFDPANPEHRDMLFAELDIAGDLGLDHLGLDGFSKLDAWLGYEWLNDMSERQPGIKFCTEAMTCDFLGTVAATYVWGVRPAGDIHLEVTQPHALADFLIPGHEIWAKIRGSDLKALHNLPPEEEIPSDIVLEHMNKLASWGYIPHVFTPADANQAMPAAESWEYSVPEAVQQ